MKNLTQILNTTWILAISLSAVFAHGMKEELTDAQKLHAAAWEPNYNRVRELLPSEGPTCYTRLPGYKPGHVITPLHIAVYTNNPELLNVLLEGKTTEDLYTSYPLILHTYDSAGFTPFHSAAHDGTAQILKHLLNFNHFGRFFETESGCDTPTYYAAKNGHLEAVQVLCDISGAPRCYSPEEIEIHRSNMWKALLVARDELKHIKEHKGDDQELIQRYERVCAYLESASEKIQKTIRLRILEKAIPFLGFREIELIGCPDESDSSIFLSQLSDTMFSNTMTQKRHTKAITSVAMRGNKVATGSEDGSTNIWDAITGKLLLSLRFNQRRQGQSVPPTKHFSNFLKYQADISSSDSDNEMEEDIFDSVIYSVAIGRDTVVTGSEIAVRVWNINTGELQCSINKDFVQSVATNDDGDKAVILSSEGVVEVLNISTKIPRRLHKFNVHEATVVAIGGDKVVVGSSDGAVTVWDISTNQPQILDTFRMHTGSVNSVIISGDKVVSGSDDMTAIVYDLPTRTYVAVNGHTGSVNAVATKGDTVVTGSSRVEIWNVRTGKGRSIIENPGPINAVAISDNIMVVGFNGHKTAKACPFELNLNGSPENNALVWITQKADRLQSDFIKCAHEATIAQQDFIIAPPKKLGKIEEGESQEQKNGRIYFSFPEHVREYLHVRLNIRESVRPIEEPQNCLIQ